MLESINVPSNAMLKQPDSEKICGRCGYDRCDLKVAGCGCAFHARCVPLTMICQNTNTAEHHSCKVCPSCNQEVQGLYLFPLSFNDISDKRRNGATLDSGNVDFSSQTGRKRSRESEQDINIEQIAPVNGGLHFRTGRWAKEETAFADILIALFGEHVLPIPQGAKLNEVLKDFLMCKSSRLTKKMKNAKLSARSYIFDQNGALNSGTCQTLSKLQTEFLNSDSTAVHNQILTFNITRMWRTHFSNLCLQIGYEQLETKDWHSSLEKMEKRISEAEADVKNTRRRRMTEALRKDSFHDQAHGVFIGGTPAKQLSLSAPTSCATVSLDSTISQSTQAKVVPNKAPDSLSVTSYPVDSSQFVSSSAVDKSIFENDGELDDFSIGFLDMDENNDNFSFTSNESAMDDKKSCLNRILEFIEERQFPFHHVDVWVPCGTSDDQSKAVSAGMLQNTVTESLKLVHAGDITSTDNITPMAGLKLKEFGIYSRNFSFAPGSGMPGRVFSSSVPCWETSVNNASPEYFRRAGGAKMGGVKTVVGIPVRSSKVGKVVIGLYSILDVPRSVDLVRECFTEFQKYDPQPKWALHINSQVADHTSDVMFPQLNEMKTTSRGIVFKPPTPRLGPVSHHNESPFNSPSDISLGGSSAVAVQKTSNNPIDMANLLAEHMPSNSGANDELTNSFVSLRLFLLRPENHNSEGDSELRTVLSRSYESYCKVNRQREEIAQLLVQDWMLLKGTQSTPKQEAIELSHVNYGQSVSTSVSLSQPQLPTSTPLTEIKEDYSVNIDCTQSKRRRAVSLVSHNSSSGDLSPSTAS